MPIDWNSVTGSASGLTPTQQAARAAASAASAVAAAQAARLAAQAANATADAVVAAARAAAVSSWRSVTGGVEGYNENEPGILQQAAYATQDVASLLTLGAVPPGTPGATVWSGAPTVSQALGAAAANVTPLGVGALLGSGTVLLVGGVILLLVLLKR